MGVRRLRVLAEEILPGDVVVGWDRSGVREKVAALTAAPSSQNIGLKIEHPAGTTGLYIRRGALVNIERDEETVALINEMRERAAIEADMVAERDGLGQDR
jgi:hypothetical protein